MEGYQGVVFTEDTRVVTGTRVAVFKANEPRKVHPELAQAALGMGARSVTMESARPSKKERPVEAAIPDEKVAALDPAKPKRRGRRKKRQEDVIISDAVEFISSNQPHWNQNQYDLNNLPRMSLFSAAVPDLTPSLREAAWDIFISGQRDG